MGGIRSTRLKPQSARSGVKARPQSLNRSTRTSRNLKVDYNDDEISDGEFEGNHEDSDTIVVWQSPTPPPPHIMQIQPEHELYVEKDSAAGVLFKSLPVEVHQHIIEYLPTDRDVAIYQRLSKETQSAVSSSVWRQRFEGVFDMVHGLNTVKLAEKYKKRRAFFKKWIIFDIKKLGGFVNSDIRKKQWHYQKECLRLIGDMIFESNASKTIDENGNEITVDLNMEFLRELTCEVRAHNVGNYLDILDALFEDDYTSPPRGLRGNSEEKRKVKPVPKKDNLMIIQLCLSSIILSPNYCITKVSHFDISQDNVYGTEVSQPLFTGRYKRNVNLSLLLHTVNFFKFHFKAGVGEGLLSDVYQGLEKDQYPQTWLGQMKWGTYELGSHWKGTYTWMDNGELMKLRNWKAEGEIYSDAVDDENSFIDMTLFFDDEKFGAYDWPIGFESILECDPYAQRDQIVESRSQRSSPRKKDETANMPRPEIKQFWGSSRGIKNGHMFGRVHALNNQGGYHGWQRVTLMKFFASPAGDYDANQVWAYEGVVLPGGRMIVGRWRDARADPRTPLKTASGPFIFWNVDRSTVKPPIDPAEALEFAKTINDPVLMGF